MVKMISDPTGRFPKRPFLKPEDLDRECESVITRLLRKRHNSVNFPISTDDLHVLIEQEDANLDTCADLSNYGPDVEGVSIFYPDRGPDVKISDQLAMDRRRENRLRTTLAHEFRHVHFHRHLWQEKFATGNLFSKKTEDNTAICKRDQILNASQSDWMEWQAGYVSGAILMPATGLRALAKKYCDSMGASGGVAVGSAYASNLIETVRSDYQVSEDAAKIRLLALKLISPACGHSSLFGSLST